MSAPATYWPGRHAPWRSTLYVPVSVRRLVAEASGAGTGTGAIILDLEDSVPAAAKADTRALLGEAVEACRASRPVVLVRINRPLRRAVRDVGAAAAARADGILVSKTAGPEHLRLIGEPPDRLEAKHPARTPSVVVRTVETVQATTKRPNIAGAFPCVVGMLVGAEDPAAECGIAAAACGPGGASLVPLLNKAYSPSQAELDLALRHIAAADAAAPERHGSFQVDGRVVDEPILRRVCQIVAASRGTAEAGG